MYTADLPLPFFVYDLLNNIVQWNGRAKCASESSSISENLQLHFMREINILKSFLQNPSNREIIGTC